MHTTATTAAQPERATRAPVAQGGFVMPVVLGMLLVGFLAVFPFMEFTKGRFTALEESFAEEEAYYAAEAGAEAVIVDLREGDDPLSGGYTLPTVSLNGYTAVITVSTPPRDDLVPFGPVFADPATATSLNPLAGNTDFLYYVYNVAPAADFQVSWVYTPTSNSWQLTAFEGQGTGGTQLKNSTGNNSPARMTVGASTITGGTYTVRFTNKSATASTSAAFSTVGDPDKTWVRVTAFKDYVITSSAGGATVTVFARQGPGPNQVSSSVHVSTWHGPN